MKPMSLLAVLALSFVLPSSASAFGLYPFGRGSQQETLTDEQRAARDARLRREQAQREAEYRREAARQEARERAERAAAAARAARRDAKITAFAQHLHGLGVDLKPLFDAANSRKELGTCQNGALCAMWTERALDEAADRWRRVPHTAVLLTAEQLKLAQSQFRAAPSAAGDYLVYMPYKGTAASREDLEKAGAILTDEQIKVAIARAVTLRENDALRNLN